MLESFFHKTTLKFELFMQNKLGYGSEGYGKDYYIVYFWILVDKLKGSD